MDERASANRIADYRYEISVSHLEPGHNQPLAEVSKNVAETPVALRPEFDTHTHRPQVKGQPHGGPLRTETYFLLVGQIHRRTAPKASHTELALESRGTATAE